MHVTQACCRLAHERRTSFMVEKVFFFEKKKQKTFIYCPQPPGSTEIAVAARNRQKFFASFFQKRRP
jgi:hypothetical protein